MLAPVWLLFVGLAVAGCTTRDEAPLPSEPCREVDAHGDVPCGDFGNLLGTTESLFVLGRAVLEEPGFDAARVAPEHDVEQHELPNLEVRLSLRDTEGAEVASFSARTDDEGWVSTRLELEVLRPRDYVLEVWASDAFLSRVKVRLLPADYDAHIVISDIDLTYLDTDFQTAAAVAELLTQTAEERAVLPGMPGVYRALRAGEGGDVDRPLVYLSGSPLFFRRVLSERTRLDDIEQDGILLKPTNLLLTHELLAGLEEGGLLSALLGQGDPLGSLTDQLGYKLTALFAQLANWPEGARLLLLGDDSESDHVVYALFHRTLDGELDLDALLETLDDLSVDDLWRDALERLVPVALESRAGSASPVDGIFINQTDVPNTELPATEWQVEGLTVLHAGGEPLLEALSSAGWVE